MRGTIILKDYAFDGEYEVSVMDSEQGFSLTICIDENKELNYYLSDSEKLKEYSKFMEDFYAMTDNYDEEEQKCIEYVLDNYDNIFELIDYVIFDFETLGVLDYIRKNPIILSKKIVLPDVYTINDYDKLNELNTKYKEFSNNIYVYFQCNDNYIKISDALKTINKIKEYCDNIKKLNLSPMETIMYVYDIVRDRVYQLESEEEAENVSRDLSEVLFGDRIVCVGYANLFYTMLKYLGIESYEVSLKKLTAENIGHKRNMVYVKDEKYNIDGVYYFDATWDSKKNSYSNNYLYSYKNFAKTRSYIDLNEFREYKDVSFPTYKKGLYDEISGIIQRENYQLLQNYLSSVNYMSKVVIGDSLLKSEWVHPSLSTYGMFDKKAFLEKLNEVISKFDREIPGEVMLELLLNVRKIQYYQNPGKYPFSYNDIYYTFSKSGWTFDDPVYNANDLYNLLFENIKPDLQDEFINYINKKDKYREIKGVQLTRVLRNYLEDKK